MLIKKPNKPQIEVELSHTLRVGTEFLPEEQVRKFSAFPDLLEKELENEAREPELSNVIKDIFSALSEHNLPKLLKTLQGDEKRWLYAFRNSLETLKNRTDRALTKREAKLLNILAKEEKSLVSLTLIK